MYVTVTFKLEAETRGELIDDFGAKYEALRGYVEKLQADNILPAHEVRWLLVGGQTRPQVEPIVVEEVKDDNQPTD